MYRKPGRGVVTKTRSLNNWNSRRKQIHSIQILTKESRISVKGLRLGCVQQHACQTPSRTHLTDFNKLGIPENAL